MPMLRTSFSNVEYSRSRSRQLPIPSLLRQLDFQHIQRLVHRRILDEDVGSWGTTL